MDDSRGCRNDVPGWMDDERDGTTDGKSVMRLRRHTSDDRGWPHFLQCFLYKRTLANSKDILDVTDIYSLRECLF